MTAIGIKLLSPDQAVMWADCELYSGGSSPSGFTPKLDVNAAICAVGCGAGFSDIIKGASAALSATVDFDELPPRICAALRAGVVRYSAYFDAEPCTAGSTYLIAGWSNRATRMVAWQFDLARFFAPILAPQSLSPDVDLPICWQPKEPADVVAVARRQMAELRKNRLSGAGAAGSLNIVNIWRGGLSAFSVPDFDADVTTRLIEKELTNDR